RGEPTRHAARHRDGGERPPSAQRDRGADAQDRAHDGGGGVARSRYRGPVQCSGASRPADKHPRGIRRAPQTPSAGSAPLGASLLLPFLLFVVVVVVVVPIIVIVVEIVVVVLVEVVVLEVVDVLVFVLLFLVLFTRVDEPREQILHASPPAQDAPREPGRLPHITFAQSCPWRGAPSPSTSKPSARIMARASAWRWPGVVR